MNKILVIVAREFNIRVRQKSFLILTLITPLFFAGMAIIPVWLGTSTSVQEKHDIILIDNSNRLNADDLSTELIQFIIYPEHLTDYAKQETANQEKYGVIILDEELKEAHFFCNSGPGLATENSIRNRLNQALKTEKLKIIGLEPDELSFVNAGINLKTSVIGVSGNEDQVNTETTSALAYLGALLIYFFILFYAAQVMRGVAEEKNNRIVEVIILSVKPFQLMMGKIIGVASVGLTQLFIWILLTIVIATIGVSFLDTSTDQVFSTPTLPNGTSQLETALNIFGNMHLGTLVPMFIFYFITGYLLYSALFAVIGSAVGQDSDAQQFSVVVTAPLIIALMLSGTILSNPNGNIAFWASLIPFTGPIVMMTRLPFGVPWEEIVLSMVTMVAAIVLVTWVAGRIYRVGILVSDSRVNFKTLVKWFLQH